MKKGRESNIREKTHRSKEKCNTKVKTKWKSNTGNWANHRQNIEWNSTASRNEIKQT